MGTTASKTPVELTDLQRALLCRAANTEMNLLRRLYGASDPRFNDQVRALELAIEALGQNERHIVRGDGVYAPSCADPEMHPSRECPFCQISDDLCEHDHPFDERHCAECGAAFDGSVEQERAEVVNSVTGRRGVVHASCYLDHDDALELA